MRPSRSSADGAEGGAPMEGLAIALIGFAAGYGTRVWQDKLARVVKGPGQAAVRTVGSALGTGTSMGGRAASAGASLGARAVRGGVVTMASGAVAASRVATRQAAGKPGGKPLTRVPVSDGGQATPSATRPKRARSTRAGTTRRSSGTTTSRSTSGPSRSRPAATGPAKIPPAEAAPTETRPADAAP